MCCDVGHLSLGGDFESRSKRASSLFATGHASADTWTTTRLQRAWRSVRPLASARLGVSSAVHSLPRRVRRNGCAHDDNQDEQRANDKTALCGAWTDTLKPAEDDCNPTVLPISIVDRQSSEVDCTVAHEFMGIACIPMRCLRIVCSDIVSFRTKNDNMWSFLQRTQSLGPRGESVCTVLVMQTASHATTSPQASESAMLPRADLSGCLSPKLGSG